MHPFNRPSQIPYIWNEGKKILTAHHLVNIILSLAFFLTKSIVPFCEFVFSSNVQCEFDRREHEILVFLGVVIFWKNRKAINWLHYLSNVFLFTRLASIGLFFRADPLIGMIYAVLCFVSMVILPEPSYTGPERVIELRGPSLKEELERNKRCVWVVKFHTFWSPECRRLTPVFAQLSEKYSLPNLRFGKVDIGRYGKEAERFRINVHPTSRQLPTIILFKDGVEWRRRPMVGGSDRAISFVFSEQNCTFDFDLNNVYNDCKLNMNKNEKSQFNTLKKEL